MTSQEKAKLFVKLIIMPLAIAAEQNEASAAMRPFDAERARTRATATILRLGRNLE